MPSDAETLKLIEQDRNRRESALAALLLLLSRNARRLLNGGMGIVNALRRAMLFPGVPVMARAMASAAAAGVRRVSGLVLGTTFDSAGLEAAIVSQYAPRAASALSSTVGTLAGKLAASLGLATFEPVSQEVAIVRAFQAAGFTEAHDHGARTAAAVAVLGPYAEGMATAYADRAVFPELTALRYVTVHDANRTRICQAYDRVQLPPTDIWWDYHWPTCHFGCRSTVLPRTAAVEFTENPPWVPAPTPGFGRRPGVILRAA